MSHTILITGASRGIGRALAVACARSGDYRKLILTCREDRTSLQETARLVCEAAPDTLCLTAVGDMGSLAFVEDLRLRFGPAETLVNNAGMSFTGLLTDLTPEQWDRLIRTNVTALYNSCHTYVPDMVRAGSGRILNVSSVWGLRGASCEVAYSASKGAVNAFTLALARELAPSHIQVNAIAPGMVDTRMNAALSGEETEKIRGEIPAGYIASPEETAEAILRLLQMPDYFTGEIVRFDGAWQ